MTTIYLPAYLIMLSNRCTISCNMCVVGPLMLCVEIALLVVTRTHLYVGVAGGVVMFLSQIATGLFVCIPSGCGIQRRHMDS